MKNRKPFDFVIFITVMILLAIGITMVFSASSPMAFYRYGGDSYKFLKQQLFFAGLGFVSMIAMTSYDYRKLGKFTGVFLVISIVLLVVVLMLPTMGDATAKRWISIGGLPNVQPSEITKISIIMFLAWSLSKRKEQLKYFFKGLFPYLIILGVIAGLLLLQPHLSTTVIIILVSFIMLFAAGAKIKHFILLALPVIPAFALAIYLAPYRMVRFVAFLDPFNEEYVKGESWQVVQSLYAIGSGGLFGRGLGRSLQKFLYIPEPFNDFIFAVLCEELGFIGAFMVIILFLIFIWRGMKIAMSAPDTFGSLLATGITSLIGTQVLINIAVVTSSIPNTGQTLPLISYGGASLLLLMTAIGILLNISRYTVGDK